MKVLGIGAHPDDVELGSGGLLLQADEAHILILSEGEVGGRRRKTEAGQSAKTLGSVCSLHSLPDTRIQARDVIPLVERCIEKVHPHIIVTHYSEDTHQDHREVYAAVSVATRRFQGTVLSYAGPSAPTFQPNWFVSLEDLQMEKKLEALRCHESQKNRPYLHEDYVTSLARYWAIATGSESKFVEPYRLMRKIV